MKPALLAFTLVLVPSGTRLATDYGLERTLRIETETVLELETTHMSVERDGESMGDFGRQSLHESTRTVLLDTPLAQADGRPTKVRRRFETVEGRVEAEFGDRSLERDRESPYDGLVVVLEREDDGEVRVEVVEGSQPPDEALHDAEGLALALDALLPAEELEVGARWELESDAIRRALGVELQRALFPPAPAQEEEGEGGGGRRRRGMGGELGGASFLASVEWQGTAELVALDEEVDGQRCARVRLELSSEGDLPEPEWGGPRGGRAFGLAGRPLESRYEVELEGDLLFAQDLRCPLSSHLAGSVRLTRHTERERNGSTLVMSSEREGTFSHTVSVTVEAREGGE